jgi:hypothetical protein
MQRNDSPNHARFGRGVPSMMIPTEGSNWTVMTSSSSPIIQPSNPSSVPFQRETLPPEAFHSSFVPSNYRANTMDRPLPSTSMPSSVFRLPSDASSSLVHVHEEDSFALPNHGRFNSLVSPCQQQEPLWKLHAPYQQQQQQQQHQPLQQPQQQPLSSKRDKKLESAQLHFSYVSNRATPVSREELRNVFSHFGPVMEVTLKKAQIKPVRYSIKANNLIIKINFLFFFSTTGLQNPNGIRFHSFPAHFRWNFSCD